MDQDALDTAVRELCIVVDALYGLYLDGYAGFHLFRQHISDIQIQSLPDPARLNPAYASGEYLDSVGFVFGKGDPNDPKSTVSHVATQGDVKARNDKGGRNERFLASLCLVMLYQHWEEEFRPRIAHALGVTVKEIRVPVFGDLRLIRNSIIHKHGIATSCVARCTVLTWFNPDDEIVISEERFEQVVKLIHEYVDSLPANKVVHARNMGILGVDNQRPE